MNERQRKQANKRTNAQRKQTNKRIDKLLECKTQTVKKRKWGKCDVANGLDDALLIRWNTSIELTRDGELRETHGAVWCEVRINAHHDKSDVLGRVIWMENSHHDQERGLRSTWLMGWIVGTTGYHACMRRSKGRTSTSTIYAAPWWEGGHIMHEERRLRSPWRMGGAQLSYGPHDGKRECAHEERRLRSLLLDG
jgi:hypothetical protein